MSVIKTQSPIVLEQASEEFAEATAKPPFLNEMTPDEARAVLDEVQAAPIDKLPVDERWVTVPADVGDVPVRIVRPPDVVGKLPVILYMHGGGWVLGNAATHDRLVRRAGRWRRCGRRVRRVRPPRQRRVTPLPSSRGTPQRSGSSARVQRTTSIPIASPLPATRSAAT